MSDLDSSSLVLQAIRELEIPVDGLAPTASLYDDLGIDSTELVELAARVSSELGVTVTAKALKDVETVADLEEAVDRLIAQLPAAAG